MKFIQNVFFRRPAHAEISSDEIKEQEENGVLKSMYMDKSSEEEENDESSEEEKEKDKNDKDKKPRKSLLSFIKNIFRKKPVNANKER